LLTAPVVIADCMGLAKDPPPVRWESNARNGGASQSSVSNVMSRPRVWFAKGSGV